MKFNFKKPYIISGKEGETISGYYSLNMQSWWRCWVRDEAF